MWVLLLKCAKSEKFRVCSLNGGNRVSERGGLCYEERAGQLARSYPVACVIARFVARLGVLSLNDCAGVCSLHELPVSRQPLKRNGEFVSILSCRMCRHEGAQHDRSAAAVSTRAYVGFDCAPVIAGSLRNVEDDRQTFRDVTGGTEAFSCTDTIRPGH